MYLEDALEYARRQLSEALEIMKAHEQPLQARHSLAQGIDALQASFNPLGDYQKDLHQAATHLYRFQKNWPTLFTEYEVGPWINQVVWTWNNREQWAHRIP